MDSVMDYLDMLEDFIEGCKAVPFSKNISVDKERLFDIIGELRLNLPNEIRESQRVIEEHDRIIDDAKNKADAIIKEGEIRAHEMAEESEVYKLANEHADDLMDKTKKSVRDMRTNATEYCDDLLSTTENAIRETLNNFVQDFHAIEEAFDNTIEVLYNNRMELRDNQNQDQK